jgi:hypothetical protein
MMMMMMMMMVVVVTAARSEGTAWKTDTQMEGQYSCCS